MINNFYNHTSLEIDLRAELSIILNGNGITTAKGIYGLLRNLNRDNSGNLIKCPCVDKVTNEPDKDYFCPICMGEKYTWTESLVKFYQVSLGTYAHGSNTVWNKTQQFGNVNISSHIFYFEYNTIIRKGDKIINISLDIEGNIIKPIRREIIWRINDFTEFRLDRGRIEFIKAFCNNEDVKYLTAPSMD